MAELRVTTSRKRGLWPVPLRGGDGVWWIRLVHDDIDWFWAWNSLSGWNRRWDNEAG